MLYQIFGSSIFIYRYTAVDVHIVEEEDIDVRRNARSSIGIVISYRSAYIGGAGGNIAAAAVYHDLSGEGAAVDERIRSVIAYRQADVDVRHIVVRIHRVQAVAHTAVCFDVIHFDCGDHFQSGLGDIIRRTLVSGYAGVFDTCARPVDTRDTAQRRSGADAAADCAAVGFQSCGERAIRDPAEVDAHDTAHSRGFAAEQSVACNVTVLNQTGVLAYDAAAAPGVYHVQSRGVYVLCRLSAAQLAFAGGDLDVDKAQYGIGSDKADRAADCGDTFLGTVAAGGIFYHESVYRHLRHFIGNRRSPGLYGTYQRTVSRFCRNHDVP